MNFLQMQTEVFTRLNESSSDPAFWTEDGVVDVKAALNEGHHYLADATEWYETEFVIPLSDLVGNYLDLATAHPMTIDEFNMDPDSAVTAHDQHRLLNPGFDFSFWSFLAFRRLFNLTTNRWLRMEDVRYLDSMVAPQWNQVTGPPQVCFIRGGWTLGFFPKATTGGVLARVAADPPSLDADGDTPGFPEEFHEALIQYALYELYLQDKEPAKALFHWSQYLEWEAKLTAYAATRAGRDRIGTFGELSAG